MKHTAYGVRARCVGRPMVHDGVRLDLLDGLRVAILKCASAGPSFPSLNVGGWKSNEQFFSWPDPSIRALRSVVRDVLDGSEAIAWAMVNRMGSSHPRHRHGGCIVSGIYYVDPGDLPLAPTIFELADRTKLEVEPVPGRLVLFPANLWHRVPPYQASRPRVTIAFDVRR